MGTGGRPATKVWSAVGGMTPRRRPTAPAQAPTTAAGSVPGHRVPCRQDFQQAGPDSMYTVPGALGCNISEGRCSRLRGQVPTFRRLVLCPGATVPIRIAIALAEPAGGKMSKASQYLFALPAPWWGARGTSQRRVPAPMRISRRVLATPPAPQPPPNHQGSRCPSVPGKAVLVFSTARRPSQLIVLRLRCTTRMHSPWPCPCTCTARFQTGRFLFGPDHP